MIIKLPVKMKKVSNAQTTPYKRQKHIPPENQESSMEYSCLEACVCCGRYMPEGSGMVCEECMKSLREK